MIIVAVDLIKLLSQTLVNWNFLILIVGGLLAAAWLLVRLAGVSSDDMESIVEKLSIIGFPVGIIALITIGAGLYLFSNHILEPETFDISTIGCLILLALVLILRPIKDFRFGTIISLAIGLCGAGLLIFLGAESIKLLSVVFIVIFLIIYGAIKLFEDLYLLIAELLASPLISIIVGIICILQGVLEILGLTIGGILLSFL